MDFLSNGFHQFYSELEDEFISWELEDTSPVCSVLSNNSCNSDYYEYVDQQEDFKFNNFLINDAGSTTFDTFQMEFDQNNDYNTCINLTDTNWENTFLENYIEIPHLIDLLPERTPLCSDSCDIFLKESSHNLSKFRPDNIVDPLRNVKEPPENEAEKTYPCTYGNCTKVYAKPAHLKAHIRRHLGDKPYVCTWPNCTWKFSRSDELARHRRSHSGIKPYKCTYCTKCFARSDHLSKHRKVHERKMSGNKLKGYFLSNLRDHVRPGRKPRDVNSF